MIPEGKSEIWYVEGSLIHDSMGASVHVLYLVSPSPLLYSLQTTYLNKELEDAKRTKANLLMMRVDPEAGSWPSESIVGLGKLANECLEEDREKRLDMNTVSLLACAFAQTTTTFTALSSHTLRFRSNCWALDK